MCVSVDGTSGNPLQLIVRNIQVTQLLHADQCIRLNGLEEIVTNNQRLYEPVGIEREFRQFYNKVMAQVLLFLQVSSIKFETYVRCFLSAAPQQQLLMDHFTATLRME